MNAQVLLIDLILTCNLSVAGGSYSGESYDGLQSQGATSQYLNSKGFGWLMEVDETNEDSQKPLL